MIRWCLMVFVGVLPNAVASPPDVRKPSTLVSGPSRIRGIAFSPDSQRLASASDDTVTVTNLATRKVDFVFKHPGHEDSAGAVWSVAFSPDGKVLATGCSGRAAWKGRSTPAGAVKLWDMATGKVVRTEVGDALTDVTALAFSPDGTYLAAGGRRSPTLPSSRREPDNVPVGVPEGELRVWRRDNFRLIARVAAPLGPVHSLAFFPDGNTIAFVSGDTTHTVRDHQQTSALGEFSLVGVKQGKVVTSVPWREDVPDAIAVAPKGGAVAVGGGRIFKGPLDPRDPVGRLILWDPARKEVKRTVEGSRSFITTVAFSPDGRLLAAGGGDYTKEVGELRLWDVESGKALVDLSDGLQPLIGKVEFSPDGKWLAAVNERSVLLWEVAAILGNEAAPGGSRGGPGRGF